MNGWLARATASFASTAAASLTAVIAEIPCAIRLKAPLPLEGEGVGGWGEAAPQDDVTQETPPRLLRPSSNPPAITPTQPSPLKGEGS